MKTSTLIAAAIIVICQVTFLITLLQNIIRNKSIINWLFPDGTSIIEKIMLISSLIIILCVMIFWP